ncbi:MAG: M14 family metallopeptidase, partial [Myxococcota bacterium]
TYRDLDGDGVVSPREGVDINRNFPFAWGRFGERGSRTRPEHGRFRGPKAASEPESRALMRLARRRSFAAAISVHTQGTVVLPPYATRGVKQPKKDEAWAVASEMARAAPRQLNGRNYRLRRRLYPVDGVWKDWLRFEMGTVAMVVEGPFHNPLDSSIVEQSIEQSRALWQTLLDRTLLGPTITGWVENEDGGPVAARVEVLESAPRAGERWLARRSDGFFVRYLIDDTPHTLRITAPGYEPLEVSTGATDVAERFVLTREAVGAAH